MASLIFLIGFNWELQEFLAIIQQEREWRIFMAQHEKFYLNGTWQLKKADETLLCPVEIPGSVLSGLTEHGLLEDPFYRMNEYPTRELLKNDFIFSREFELKKEEGRVYALCCDGIDTVADIFINGMLIKHVDNMHLRYRILCTNVLKNGTNNITVKIHSAIAYVNMCRQREKRFITRHAVRWKEISISGKHIPCLAGTGVHSYQIWGSGVIFLLTAMRRQNCLICISDRNT
mgnify:CR=1 FL=1